MSRLDDLRARLAAITPGAWIAEGNVVRHELGWFYWKLADEGISEKNHAAFIAAAPADLAWCVARVDALETALREARTTLMDIHLSPEFTADVRAGTAVRAIDALLTDDEEATP